MDFDIVQVPYSIFDQRFDEVFGEMKARGVEIHVRSIFLQGVFFRSPDALPQHFKSIEEQIRSLHEMAQSSGLGIAALCLGFGLMHPHIDQVVIGVDRVENLEENLRVARDLDQVKAYRDQLSALRVDDEQIILPVNWVLD